MPPKAAPVNIAALVEQFVRLRDKREKLSKAYKEADDKLKDQMQVITADLLSTMNNSKLDTMRTEHGTVSRLIDIKPSATDWTKIYAWVKKHDAFEMFNKRLNTSFIKEYMDEHDGKLPPGVNIHQEYVVRVRRS